MPYRNIRACIFDAMKPYQLIAALMHRENLGALPLAKKMGKPALQPQIHRFMKGEVANPARTTAVPLAKFFDIPVDAIYDEKVATAVARDRDVRALPSSPPAPRRASAPTPRFGKETLRALRTLATLSAPEREQLLRLLHEGADQGQVTDLEPERPLLGSADSGLAPFQDKPHKPPTKKGKK